MAFKTYKDLQKAVMEMAKEGMQKSVLPIVQKQMQQSIKEVVYDAYKPIAYHDRRMFSNGGLGDAEVIKGYMVGVDGDNHFDFIIQNEARPHYPSSSGDGLLAPLIIKGKLWAMNAGYAVKYDWITPRYDRMLMAGNTPPFTPYYEPRDFISHTVKSLNKSQLTKELKQYMSGR